MRNLMRLFQRIHADQRGTQSVETVLVLGALALPALIFLVKFGWPKIRDFFVKSLYELFQAAVAAKE